MRHKNGDWVWGSERGKAVERDADGKPTKMYGTRADITENKPLGQRLRELAIRGGASALPTAAG